MKLEVLPAKKGDCLILHSDTPNGKGLILIDGGPAGVSKALIERLNGLRQERKLTEDKPLIIDLLIVSHVDDDHINGVIDLFEAMLQRKKANLAPLYRVRDLWHNSFDRILGNDETGNLAAKSQFGAASMDPVIEEAEPGAATDHAKILASVKQGDDLKRLAAGLGIPVNRQFGGKLIQTAEPGAQNVTVAGIEMVVLGPRRPELLELQEDFDKWLKDRPASERTEASLLAALKDESAANLSSIVLLARKDGKTILLTGDARSDKLLDGMEETGLVEKGGSIEVGILKMPHHGSIHNLDEHGDFLRRITSRHYVFSGNGEHGNPDRETFDLLLHTRPGADMTFHLTYTFDEIDPVRRKIHEKEQGKKEKKGQAASPWSDAANALAAALRPAPQGVTVKEHDGGTMTIEP